MFSPTRGPTAHTHSLALVRPRGTHTGQFSAHWHASVLTGSAMQRDVWSPHPPPRAQRRISDTARTAFVAPAAAAQHALRHTRSTALCLEHDDAMTDGQSVLATAPRRFSVAEPSVSEGAAFGSQRSHLPARSSAISRRFLCSLFAYRESLFWLRRGVYCGATVSKNTAHGHAVQQPLDF